MLTTYRRRSDILKVSLTKRIDIEYRSTRWMQSPEGISIAFGRSGQIIGATIHPASQWLPAWLLAEPKSFINSDDGRTITFGSDQRKPVTSMPLGSISPTSSRAVVADLDAEGQLLRLGVTRSGSVLRATNPHDVPSRLAPMFALTFEDLGDTLGSALETIRPVEVHVVDEPIRLASTA